MSKQSEFKVLNEKLAKLSLAERLQEITRFCRNPVFTTGLNMEDQYLTWRVFNDQLPIRIVTLQTSKLFPETSALISITRDRFAISIEEIEADKVEAHHYMPRQFLDGFRKSFSGQKSNRAVSNLRPLGVALKNADAWITGLRRDQNKSQKDIPIAQWDTQYNIAKFNPLADASFDEIFGEIMAHEIPINPLHHQDFQLHKQKHEMHSHTGALQAVS